MNPVCQEALEFFLEQRIKECSSEQAKWAYDDVLANLINGVFTEDELKRREDESK